MAGSNKLSGSGTSAGGITGKTGGVMLGIVIGGRVIPGRLCALTIPGNNRKPSRVTAGIAIARCRIEAKQPSKMFHKQCS